MKKHIPLLFSLLSLVSCQRIRSIPRDIENKIFPIFDSQQADTKYNRQRFREFLQVERTSDVQNIYCHADDLGIDLDFQFAFNCDTATVSRIIQKHALVPAPDTIMDASAIQDDFPWWDKNKINRLKLYYHEGEHQYFQYFWYDSGEQKAYYFDFDL